MTRRGLLYSAFALSLKDRYCWIRRDLRTGAEKRDWPNLGAAVSFGSLLKPFLVLAYDEPFPVVFCRGTSDRCWSAKGHGRQDVLNALKNSCNAYFLQLAGRVNRAALDQICLSYGLMPPERAWPAERLMGLGMGWPNTPESVAEAFARLTKNPPNERIQLVLEGMALCAESGTGKQSQVKGYVKTGTAPCIHKPNGLGDGYAVAMVPREEPRTLVLLGRHGTTGAEACRGVREILNC